MPHQIVVHEKALAHLSRGLYRSPASALRELVSNAWDANATLVRINTSHPNFLQLVVEDNGDGFTKSEFSRLMGGGIGNSEKRAKHADLKRGRPTVGRLGIGMLGIAQICGSFTVTSRTRDGATFKARVRLYDLLKDRLDKGDRDVYNDDAPVTEVNVGTYDFEKETEPLSRPGTRIIADELHPTFVRSFKESISFPDAKIVPLDWKKALDEIADVHSLQQLGHYWRLIWELAASCPVPYVSEAAVPDRRIAADQKRLVSYDFNLIVDGLELRKPVNLHGNKDGYSTWDLGEQTQRVYAKDLRFHGYIVVQEGKQLKPDELRGIMIRINNVAIGYYDSSLLDFRSNEGPRSRWVTGEIYVDSGLEDALNIDRDSFNRFHPHFRAVQEFVHGFLRDKVFPQTYKQIDVRSKKRRATKATQRTKHLLNVISERTNEDVSLDRTATRAAAMDSKDVSVEKQGSKLVLSIPETAPTKKSNQALANAILTVFEVALRESNRAKQRDLFHTLVMDLLKKW